ncbi:hypothetical protein FQN55_007052 [Onygenales sp. PD_40]|nr:hypothetical protein FQN55_007052 [Onygenales sp. PD_40]
MSRHGDASSTSSGGGGGRWDASRFFRERDERQEPRRERRGVDVAERERSQRRRPGLDDLLAAAEERFGPPARRPDRTYQDDHLLSSSGAIIPYKERELSPPPRPRLLRRQSSLDTFDRAATRRAYEHFDREDYGPPVTPIPIPRRRRSPPPPPPSVPRSEEVDFEEIRIVEPEYYGDEEFHQIRPRERSRAPRERVAVPPPPSDAVTIREIRPRRGKTRMPKRIVHPRALLDSGYEYEDEGDTYLLFQALHQTHIDDLITRSKEIRRTANTTEIKDTLAVGPPRETISMERRRSRSRRPSVMEVQRSRRQSVSRTEPPVRHHRRRRSSPIRIIEPRDAYEDVIEPRMDVALIAPRYQRSEREIQAEIRALERERRQLRNEREGNRLEVEEVADVRREPKAPSPRLIRAMMATLT